MNGLALCAGGGGLDLAMQVAVPGYRTVGYVEREAGAAASLVARMEDKTLDQAPIWDDLGTFDGKPWCGLVDLITSGDPCQPNSTAGKRQGEDDDRWLIDQVIRIIKEVRPSVVFRENVTGNIDGQLAALIPPLERLGYRLAAGIFAAAETGASHQRERLFIMANRYDPGCHTAQLPIQSRRQDQANTDAGREGPDLAYASSIGERKQDNQASTITRKNPRAIIGRGGSELADAICGGHNGRSHEPKREAVKRTVTQGSSNDIPGVGLADTGGAGLQGREFRGSSGRRDRSETHGSVTEFCSAQLPLFAPGPGDFDAWREILAIDPLLEPALCRTVDELAYRNDRLRLCGNGVFPLEGAYAFRTLSALLGIDRGTAIVDV